MITIIVILAYVASVFMARWFNKQALKKNKYYDKCYLQWLIPLAGMFAWMFIYLDHLEAKNMPKFIKWFIGDNW